jgi:hypothetical protein
MTQFSPLVSLRAKLKGASPRLFIALACYLVLILIALYGLLPVRTSNDRFVLGFVLLVFALLIVKTIIHTGEDKPE